MKNKLGFVWFCLAVFCLFSVQGKSQTVQGLSADKVEQIDSLVKEWMPIRKAPALSVAVVYENKVIFSKGYGVIDVENSIAAQSETAYRLASISKSLTAVAVMQLVERGKLDLDKPISKYCGVWNEKQSLKDAPDKKFSITARQLLTHFAGVLHYRPNEPLNTFHFTSINEAVKAFRDEPLLFEPDTRYSYSTPGYTLLGCAIEGASGMSYLDYLQENVLKPAGMTRTQADNVYKLISNRSRGYAKSMTGEVQNAPLHDTSGKIPAGGLVSTVEDIARFSIALNAGKLVKPETLEKMWTKPQTLGGTESEYGYGFIIGVGKNGQRRIYNDGSQAGTRTYFSMLPKIGYSVVLMTNIEGVYCEELIPKITDVIFDTVKKTNPNINPNIYDQYVGQYQIAPNLILTITKENNRLFAEGTGQGKLELFPETETRFFTRSIDSKVTFVKDEGGKVITVIIQQGGREAKANKIK